MDIILNSDFNLERSLKGWQHFINKGEIMYSISAPITRSWLRCQRQGLPPVRLLPSRLPILPEAAEFPERITEAFENYCSIVFQHLPESKIFLALIGKEGALLRWQGNAGFLLTGELYEKADFREETLGTMAAPLTLKEGKPYQTTGPEHYYSCYHSLTNYAIPLMLAGDCIGVLSGWSALEDGDFMSAIIALGKNILENN